MPDVIKRANVRMIQAGNGAGFALEPFSQFRTVSKMRRQNLDGDNAVEAGIFGAVNLTHSARTNPTPKGVIGAEVVPSPLRSFHPPPAGPPPGWGSAGLGGAGRRTRPPPNPPRPEAPAGLSKGR